MTLEEVVGKLDEIDDDATIYAERPFQPGSRAVVAYKPDDGSTPAEGVGLAYFMEVEIAREAADCSNAGSRLDRVLYYGENDAYLFELRASALRQERY